MTLFQFICIAKKFKLTYQRPQKSPCSIAINDDGGRACDAGDGQTSALQPCGFCLPHDAHREHNLQALRLLPQQLELPCDVDVHAQDPLSLHVAHRQQKPQFPELLLQPYVRSVYACALAPASADIAVLDTTREHRLNLGPASSENFRHTAQEGMLSHTHYCRSRIALRRLALSSPDQGDSKELHSQALHSQELHSQELHSKAHQNLDPGGDDGDDDATSSILFLPALLESETLSRSSSRVRFNVRSTT